MAASYRSHPLYWWFYAAMSYMSVVIISILFIWHLVNFVSDFCTKSRRSVRWRKKPPAITKLYSALSITALLAIALFVTGNVLHAFIALSEYSDKCVRVIKSMSTTYCFGKASMYLNFILRVHLVYSDTQYAYKTRYLCIFALLSVLGALVAAVLNEYFVYADSVLYEHAAMSHALHCDTWIPWFSVVIFGSFDALVQLGYLYAFANPLRLMIKAQQAESVSNTNLWSMGTKSFILSLVATVTTVGFMSSLLIMNSIFFGGSDGVINSICIMMMTPYYNAKYYNKMCCLMIRGMQHFAKKHGAEPQLQVAVTNATNLEKTASTDGTNSKPTLTTTMSASSVLSSSPSPSPRSATNNIP